MTNVNFFDLALLAFPGQFRTLSQLKQSAVRAKQSKSPFTPSLMQPVKPAKAWYDETQSSRKLEIMLAGEENETM
jgi:hypothetical protein